MNNQELARLLKCAPLPTPRERFENQLVTNVLRRASMRGVGNSPLPTKASAWPCYSFALGVSVICGILLLIFAHFRQVATPAISNSKLARAERYYMAIHSLFPRQIRAITLGAEGPSLLLSDKPDVPQAEAVLVEISNASGSATLVVVAGQGFSFNGEHYEVLLDQGGNVIIMGPDSAWSSAAPRRKGSLLIAARILNLTS